MASTINVKIAPLPRGDYSSSATYAKLDVVSYNGSSYMAIKAVPMGTVPTNTTYWQLLAEKPTIGDGSITTNKLANGAVTDAKLAQSGGVLEEVANLKSDISDVYEKYSDFKVRLSKGSLEFGNYTLSDGSLVKSDSTWWIRNKTPIKVPAYSQFIITNPAFRGHIYVSTDGVTYTSYNWLTSANKRFMPLVDSYVAFKFSNSDNYSTPTIADVYAGFYIQFPFDTKDYSDLVSYDSELRPSLKVNPHGMCIIGSISNGVPNLNNSNRVVFVDLLSFKTDITINIASGFGIGVHTFVNGAFASDSGWKYGTYNVSANTTFKLVIRRSTEQTETATNWWFDFVKAVTFEPTAQVKPVPNISMNKPFMFSSRPKFMLHRGLQSEAPENSVPAFRLAGQRGAWAIETDVYETSDGHFVCIHDDTVDRTTDGTGNVRDKTLAQIEALTIDVGSNIDQYPNLKIPTFEEYLAVCKTYGCVAFIEIKGVTNLQSLYDMVVDYGMLYNSVFTVWEALLLLVRAVDTEAIVPCMLNGYASAESYAAILTTAKKYPNVMLGLETGANLTDAVIQEAHENDITVGCWTVNNSATAIGYFERGIDIVTTNSLTDFN